MSTSASRDTSEELNEFVREVALLAGELQLSRLNRPGDIREKQPKDIVTEVDLLCEEAMISAIEKQCPDDSILSEEQGGEISPTGRTWLLDPVDGTANFSRANPMFCSCVAILEDGFVTHAAVAAPRLRDLYHARLGGGAYLETGGETFPLKVSETAELEYAFVGADISFIAHGSNPRREGIQEVFDAAWQSRSLGSAGIRGAWMAAGYLDISIGTRNTAWDYAPTVLLVNEAGGFATDFSGEAWTPNSDGLVATNASLHQPVIRLLNT